MIGSPGMSSPRPNRQSTNTSQLGEPYLVPNTGSASGRINVVRPPSSTFAGLSRDPYGYALHSQESSGSESAAHINSGFFMKPASNPQRRHDLPKFPAGETSRDISSPEDSYMTYDDNLFVFKYSSDGETTYPTKSAESRTKSWNDGSKDSGANEDDPNRVFEFCQETGFDGLKHAGDDRLPKLMR